MPETTRTSEPKYEDLPTGTPVLAFPGSRDGRAIVTTTRSEPWTLPSGERVVMVEGYAGGIAMSHIEVMPDPMTAQHPAAPEGRPRTVARCPRVDLHESHRWTPEPTVIHNANLCPGISKVIDGRAIGLLPAAPETGTDANGLTEAEKTYGRTDPSLHWRGRWYSEASVERIVAERVRVVEGERDAARVDADTWHSSHLRSQILAESAEAAHERLRVVAESIAYEHAATVDGEFGCCHDEDALRAGGRVAEFDGDEFEPIPADCLGQKTLDRHLATLAGNA